MSRAEENLTHDASEKFDDATHGRTLRFFALLEAWNARINLTGRGTAAELQREHLADSVVLAQAVPPAAKVVDVGSGGGLPAIPFAVLRPDVVLTLVEPRAKRVAFLRTAVRELGLHAVEVLRARAEDLPDGGHDFATSRATFAPDEWCTIGRRLVGRPGSVIVFSSAKPPDQCGAGLPLARSIAYQSGSGKERWLGIYRCE